MSTASRRKLDPNEHFCTSCGEIIKKAAETCPKCGVRIKEPPAVTSEKKKGSKLKTFSLSIIGISVLLIVVISLLPSEGQEETIDDNTSNSDGSLEVSATPTPKPKTTFDGNLSAFSKIKVGMGHDEVFRMEKKTKDGKLATLGIRQLMDFQEISDEYQTHWTFELSDGRSLRLTPELHDFPCLHNWEASCIESIKTPPYFAYIIHPKISAASRPTLILFEMTNSPLYAKVIHVSRASCETVAELILRATTSVKDWPPHSACRS